MPLISDLKTEYSLYVFSFNGWSCCGNSIM